VLRLQGCWQAVSEGAEDPAVTTDLAGLPLLFSGTHGPDGGGRGRRTGLRELSDRALAEALIQQPARESEQGGQQEGQRGRGIPQLGGGDKAAGSVLSERHDEWQVGKRCIASDPSRKYIEGRSKKQNSSNWLRANER